VNFNLPNAAYYQQLAGYSTAMSFKLFVCLQVVSVFGNICSWWLIDRVGRRNLTLWGTMLLTVILLLCGGLAAAGTTKSIKACIAFMVVYGWFYNITIGSTAYTLLTEVATSRLRVKTISIGIACQSAWYTMWSFTLPYLFNPDKANLGAKVHLNLITSYYFPHGNANSLHTGCIHLRRPISPLLRLSLVLPARNRWTHLRGAGRAVHEENSSQEVQGLHHRSREQRPGGEEEGVYCISWPLE
jgi:hypothetical protein